MSIIGICGGTGCGKTSIAQKIGSSVGSVTILHLDDFYKSLDAPELQKQAAENEYNFDHPDAIDFDLLRTTLKTLKSGEPATVPIYQHSTHTVVGARNVDPAKVIIVEGIHVFTDPAVRELFDLSIFVDVDADTRLARRIRRDISDRNRTVVSVLDQYEKYVKPAYDLFIAPCKRFADIIVPGGAKNEVAIDMIITKINAIGAV